ncbi:retrovirus-related pol polyprotein from transposon TNT 1-94 [Tanacetum coccineum]|uniref:Retrovirus-related pol polyprotein from transposon TNT 1-94 n=1 Tax=Tanacetum coccineum TaxID=301880 RepID=A0ABQ5D5D6_9ASTR
MGLVRWALEMVMFELERGAVGWFTDKYWEVAMVFRCTNHKDQKPMRLVVFWVKLLTEWARMMVIMVENQNDVKVKQIRTDNGTEFRNSKLESFCNEKGISQNFSSFYTPEQNGVAERKNRTLIEAARTMLNGSVLSKNI